MRENSLMKFETDLHSACGLGSAKSGLHHWIIQRITAIALIPLSLWFVYAFIVLVTGSYEQALGWLSSPWTVTFAILFIVLMFYHGYLGLQVIIEDYVYQPSYKWALLISVKFMSVLMAVLASLSILKIFLS